MITFGFWAKYRSCHHHHHYCYYKQWPLSQISDVNPFNNLLKSLMFYYFDKFHQHTFGASGFADTFFINIVRFFFVLVTFYIILFFFFIANLPILFYRNLTPKKQEGNIDIRFYLLFLWTVYLVTNKFLWLLKWVWVLFEQNMLCSHNFWYNHP